MADHGSGNSHDASDKKLDKAAFASVDEAASGSQGHDPAKIRQHDDAGKDRLFEGREQHDDAEKNSEKSRLAKDVDRHHHEENKQVADSGSGDSTKRKS